MQTSGTRAGLVALGLVVGLGIGAGVTAMVLSGSGRTVTPDVGLEDRLRRQIDQMEREALILREQHDAAVSAVARISGDLKVNRAGTAATHQKVELLKEQVAVMREQYQVLLRDLVDVREENRRLLEELARLREGK